ncbi:dehydrodolichyl diphosphate synthase complex subunit DHDDS [Phlebotomus papatasi]|uniref:dehydrodolichyl diphosphate synthase complex subunit DHDDS n=1 Tax=Phlebotomus papatasi TaxID=29031 RepID=UPI002483FBBE|nr:dehydrodolichyl diphosphate synthase complex subunit DHDDS [Phlebotomus papatasi]XP_055716991.1 dehydrodolichyl diphosphate synthase complex subunit DHDDS [Phlebotomus papatasi]
MSWVSDTKLPWWQRFAVSVVKVGKIPDHIAFIMDGNRRFAKKIQVEKAEGHSRGFEKLSNVLQWCLDLGVKEVTVYAFSIENFKRSKDEVDALLNLASDKFDKLIEEKDKLNENGICIRIIGNLEMLPVSLQQKIARAMHVTRMNSRAILNVAFAYTSRDEITHSVRTITEGVNESILDQEAITDELINRCLHTKHSTNPDLLIRTSGETRLSDFLLWQVSSTILYFTKILWPEITIWHLLGAIIQYQRFYYSMKIPQKFLQTPSGADTSQKSSREQIEHFVSDVDNRHWKRMQELIGQSNSSRVGDDNSTELNHNL